MDAERDKIAAAQFDVDGEIKQREISGAMIQLQSNSDGPDLFQLQRRLLTQQFAFVPWYCTFSGLRRHDGSFVERSFTLIRANGRLTTHTRRNAIFRPTDRCTL